MSITKIDSTVQSVGKNCIEKSVVNKHCIVIDSSIIESYVNENCIINKASLHDTIVFPNVEIYNTFFNECIIYASIKESGSFLYLYYDKIKRTIMVQKDNSINNINIIDVNILRPLFNAYYVNAALMKKNGMLNIMKGV